MGGDVRGEGSDGGLRGRWVGATVRGRQGSTSGRCALDAGGQLTVTSRRLHTCRSFSKGATGLNQHKAEGRLLICLTSKSMAIIIQTGKFNKNAMVLQNTVYMK